MLRMSLRILIQLARVLLFVKRRFADGHFSHAHSVNIAASYRMSISKSDYNHTYKSSKRQTLVVDIATRKELIS